MKQDTTQLAEDTKVTKKGKGATVSVRGKKNTTAKETNKQKESKPKAQAQKTQKSAPVRSIRRK